MYRKVFLLIWTIFIVFGCSFLHKQKVSIKEQQSTNPVLLSNRIHCISASSEDVWIATDQGVNRYTDNKWFEYTIEDGLADNNVNAVAVDGDFVWFGTSSGLSRYNKVKQNWKTFTRDQGIASNIISALAVDGNYLWVGTPQGLSRYNKSLDVWALHTKEDGGIYSNKINAIVVEDDYVWVATNEGVSRYDKKKDSWNKYNEEDGLAENDIRCIAIGEDSVWFGAYNSGVSKFSKIDQTFVKTYTRDILTSDKIKSIFIDNLYLWIGTANAGVQRYIPPVDTWMQYTRDDGLASNHITSIESQRRYVWFGTSEHGVSRFDKVTGIFSNFTKKESLVSNNIKEIISDGNSLWVCTPMGLGNFSLNSGVWKRFTKADGLVSDYVTCVAINDKDIWMGSSKGLGYYSNEIKRWKFWSVQDGLPDNLVLSIAIFPGKHKSKSAPDNRSEQSNRSNIEQELWVGTLKGLTVYNSEKDQWLEIASFAGKSVTAIAFITDVENFVLVGTENGLFYFNKNEIPEVLSVPIIKGYINEVVVYDKQIYACSQSGLTIIDKQTLNIDRQYTDVDGLPSNNVRDVLKLNGELWLATPKGLCRFDKSGDLSVYNLENTGTKMGHENVQKICLGDESAPSIWLATECGVSKLSIEKNSWELFKAQDTEEVLRHSYIPQILLDENQIWSYSWYGTVNGEIIKYDKRTDNWTLYTKDDICCSAAKVVNRENKNEIQNNEKLSIMFVRWADSDDESVWFATNAGVLCYSKLNDTWRHYTVSDGLASNRTTWLKIDEDYVWVRFSDPRICWYNKRTKEWHTKEISSKEGWNVPRKIAMDEQYVWIPNGWDGIWRYNKQNGSWRKYTTRDGLGEPSVENVVVSGDYVWVEEGAVNRYDYETDTWEIIDGSTGLARTGGIRDLFDGRDYLWILYHASQGERGRAPVAASGYHKSNHTWQTFRGNPETVGNDFISVREADDVVWFASDEHGLSRYDKASSSWTVYTEDDGLLSNEINDNTLQVDERYVWVGTEKGFSRYDTITGGWTSYTGKETLTNNRIRTIAVDGRYIWCGTENGLSRYDKRYNEWTNFRARRFDWWRYDGYFELEEFEGLSDNNVTSISVDPKYVWVGTQDGMNRYDKSANRWDTYDRRNSLPNSTIRTTAVGKSEIWIGTPNGVAKYARLSDDPNAWESFNKTIEVEAGLVSKRFAKSLVSNDVRCLYLDNRYLWAGTKKGVSRYDTSREVWVDIKPQISSEQSTSDSEYRQWLKNTSVIAVDGNSVWFGSEKGVTCWNQETDIWKHYTESDGLVSNNITDIAITDDSVWVTTFDNGVSRYLKDLSQWQNFTKKDGLSHNSVFSIAVDGKFLWFGTEMGLSRYDTVTDTWTVFTANFDEESF